MMTSKAAKARVTCDRIHAQDRKCPGLLAENDEGVVYCLTCETCPCRECR